MNETRPVGTAFQILVSEKDGSARAALTRVLQKEGFNVKSVATTKEALHALCEFPSDLVISDIRSKNLP